MLWFAHCIFDCAHIMVCTLKSARVDMKSNQVPVCLHSNCRLWQLFYSVHFHPPPPPPLTLCSFLIFTTLFSYVCLSLCGWEVFPVLSCICPCVVERCFLCYPIYVCPCLGERCFLCYPIYVCLSMFGWKVFPVRIIFFSLLCFFLLCFVYFFCVLVWWLARRHGTLWPTDFSLLLCFYLPFSFFQFLARYALCFCNIIFHLDYCWVKWIKRKGHPFTRA